MRLLPQEAQRCILLPRRDLKTEILARISYIILDIPPTPLVSLRVASKKACKGGRLLGEVCVWEEAAGQGSTQRSYGCWKALEGRFGRSKLLRTSPKVEFFGSQGIFVDFRVRPMQNITTGCSKRKSWFTSRSGSQNRNPGPKSGRPRDDGKTNYGGVLACGASVRLRVRPNDNWQPARNCDRFQQRGRPRSASRAEEPEHWIRPNNRERTRRHLPVQ